MTVGISTMSEIAALGYIGIETANLEAWRSFAADILGVQVLARDDGSLVFRLDDYASRVHLKAGRAEDLAFIGWEVADAQALKALHERLTAAGISVERGDESLARERGVAAIIRFRDPEETQLEAYYGPLQQTQSPVVSPLSVRFKTGSQGLGHVVLSCRDSGAMERFYTEILGFRVSDYINTEIVPGRPLRLAFLRCNGRHHSLALAPVPIPKKLVHVMLEVAEIDDVGRALYRCQDAGIHISMTLGRHSNDQMLSFYAMSPSGFDVEYGWGGLTVEDETWHVLTHDQTSAWGHRFQRPPKKQPA